MGHGIWRPAVAVITLAVAFAIGGHGSYAQAPDLAQVLARAGQYVQKLDAALGLVVAEERYAQTAKLIKNLGGSNFGVSGGGDGRLPGDGLVEKGTRKQKRQSRSEVVMRLRPGTPLVWEAMRYVLDGDSGIVASGEAGAIERAAGEGGAALATLWRNAAPKGRAVHLGDTEREVASPLAPLTLLRDGVRDVVEFKKDGEEKVGGASLWKVSFTERGRLVLPRATGTTADPLRGTFWIDPADGRVLRLRIETADRLLAFQVRTEVDFAPEAALGVLVPRELRERYESPSGKVEGRATYSGFRRVAGS